MSFGTTPKPPVDGKKLYDVVTSDNLENPEYFRGPGGIFDAGVDAEIQRKTVINRETNSISDPLNFENKTSLENLPHLVIESPLIDMNIFKRLDQKWFAEIHKDFPVIRFDFYHLKKKKNMEPDLRNPFTYSSFLKLFPKDPAYLIIKYQNTMHGPLSLPFGITPIEQEVSHYLDNIKKALRQRN